MANKTIEKRIQMKGVDGKKRNLKFPSSTTVKDLELIKKSLKRLVAAQALNAPFFPQDIKWLETQGKMMRRRLKTLGVELNKNDKEEQQEDFLLKNIVSEYLKEKEKETVDDTTVFKYIRAGKLVEEYFGSETDIRDVTTEKCKSFVVWLTKEKNLAAASTARRTVGSASSFFKRAVKHELISTNPFTVKEIKKQVKANKERHHYISSTETEKIWNVLKTDDDKLRFVLMRYLGLRSPSEINELRWKDFDFEDGIVTIRSPKLKRYEDKYERECPFTHPVAFKVISEAYEKRKSDRDNIVPSITNHSLRKRVTKWLGAAGVDVWPDLLVNFRRSAITDACDILPSHVVAAFFGHSEIISTRHYRLTTKAHGQVFKNVKTFLKEEEDAA